MKAQKLKSGNYRVVLPVGYDSQGKRKYKSFTADEEWKVLKMASEYKEESEEKIDSNITVSKAMNEYINTRVNVVEPTTIRNYRQIAQYCFSDIAGRKLNTLKPIDVQKAINTESTRISAKYLKNAYALLKAVFKLFEVDINLGSVKLPKIIKKEKELPTFEEVFNIVKGTNCELPVLLSAWLSLRIGEVIGLQYQDIDEINMKIKIRRTIIFTENGYQVRDHCKTEKSTRTIQLPLYLLNLIKSQPHEKETDFIVTATRKAVYSRFKRLVERQGIDMTFHDLRHLNASVMLMLGIPDKYAMERGGWSTDGVLKSVYQQTFDSEKQKVDMAIDNYFQSVISSCNSIN